MRLVQIWLVGKFGLPTPGGGINLACSGSVLSPGNCIDAREIPLDGLVEGAGKNVQVIPTSRDTAALHAAAVAVGLCYAPSCVLHGEIQGATMLVLRQCRRTASLRKPPAVYQEDQQAALTLNVLNSLARILVDCLAGNT